MSKFPFVVSLSNKPFVVSLSNHALGADARLSALTTREREIVAGLVAGRTNAQIAASLFISDKTVRNALTRIFEKLGVRSRSRTQAMALLRDSDLSR